MFSVEGTVAGKERWGVRCHLDSQLGQASPRWSEWRGGKGLNRDEGRRGEF